MKNHLWLLIFFWFFAFMQKMICVGTTPLSGYLKCRSWSSPNEVVYSKRCAVVGSWFTSFCMYAPGWYTPSSVRQSSTRGCTLDRPSATIHTTT